LGVGLASLAFLHFREEPPAEAVALRFQISPPENATNETLLNVSPDGRKFAFLAGDRLWVHFFESGESRELGDASGTPFWSPDSRFIGYPSSGKLRKVEATGGIPQTLTDFRGPWGGGAWSQDGLIVFSNWSAFFHLPAAGGVPVQIAAVDRERQETVMTAASFLPDGRHFTYMRRSRDESKSAIYLGAVDLKPEQQSSEPLLNSFWHSQYTPSADSRTGYLLFMRGDTLMGQPFDNRRMKLSGQAAPVAEHIGDGRAFAASANGALVFRQNSMSNRHLSWLDQEGKALGTAGDPDNYRWLALSPDGTRVAFSRNDFGSASEIWLLDLSRGTVHVLPLVRRATQRFGRRMGTALLLLPTGTARSTCIKGWLTARKMPRFCSSLAKTKCLRVGRAMDVFCCIQRSIQGQRTIFGCSRWKVARSRFHS